MSVRYSEEQFAALTKRNRRLRVHDQTTKRQAPPAPKAKRDPTAPRKDEVVREESAIEKLFSYQITCAGLPKPKRNYLFLADRKCELDYAWADRKIAVEVQGMQHRIKGRFLADLEKRALVLLAGWQVLEVGGDQIRSEQAIAWLQALLLRKGKDHGEG